MRTPQEAAKEYADNLNATDAVRGLRYCAEIGFEAGAEWAKNSGYNRDKLNTWGTDGCRDCEFGRITLFAEEHGLCLECQNKKFNKP
jgi:hypothetical protein